MSTTVDFIEYVCKQIEGIGVVRYRKMFGEYMVYINDKPVITICDNTVFIKQLDCVAEQMQDAKVGAPYKGAKPHYILDIDNADFAREIIRQVEAATPLPKKKKKAA